MLEAFMWGYWGWGGSTGELVEAFDAAEGARGFAPPLFVDARASRGVRALGFRGDAFAQKFGSERYRWMRGLGNRAVFEGQGPMRLMDDGAVGELLDEIVASQRSGRRVIFFCACVSPRNAGERYCHRELIGELLVDEARRRNVALAVSEWPGGSPRQVIATFNSSAISKWRKRAQSVRCPAGIAAPVAASLPWGSYAVVNCPGGSLPLVLGPAIHSGGRWAFALPWRFPDGVPTESELRRHILADVARRGCATRYSNPSEGDGVAAWQELVIDEGAPRSWG